MHSADLETKMGRMNQAAEWYPWDFRFRSAPAKQLFFLAREMDGLAPVAAAALEQAHLGDPGSVEIASMLFGAYRAIGECDKARLMAGKMLALAPGSLQAQNLARLPCG